MPAVRVRGLILILVLLSGCKNSIPEVCRSSPPESDAQYNAWAQARKHANCDQYSKDSAENGSAKQAK
jgi:hypothetical protein